MLAGLSRRRQATARGPEPRPGRRVAPANPARPRWGSPPGRGAIPLRGMSEHPSEHRVIDHLADAVLTVDAEGRVTLFNRAAEALVGIPASLALGARVGAVLASDGHALERILLEATRRDRPILNQGVYLDLADGRRLPVSVTASALTDEQGVVRGAVGTVRDLTGVFQGYLSGVAGDPRGDLRKALLQLSSFAGIISRNHAMRDLFAVLPEIASTSSTVLIMGPSGSGKELFARAVHDLSPRRDGPLVVVNCGALPDTLLESELFGYKAGAFTDARRDKPGLLAQADGGTLFLDEIGDISPAMQVRLLRVLQEGEFSPLGSTGTRRVDLRVVAATHRDLDALVQQGRFRQDLFFRLDIVRLRIPPLRARREDIPLLAVHFLERLSRRRERTLVSLGEPALDLLMRHDFPGNVRELENVLEHASVLCGEGPIEPAHLPERLRRSVPRPGAVDEAATLEDLEARFLTQALARNDHRVGRTAAQLGVHRTTLWRRLRRLGIRPGPQD
jgi:PAS domain S-box-containing protein